MDDPTTHKSENTYQPTHSSIVTRVLISSAAMALTVAALHAAMRSVVYEVWHDVGFEASATVFAAALTGSDFRSALVSALDLATDVAKLVVARREEEAHEPEADFESKEDAEEEHESPGDHESEEEHDSRTEHLSEDALLIPAVTEAAAVAVADAAAKALASAAASAIAKAIFEALVFAERVDGHVGESKALAVATAAVFDMAVRDAVSKSLAASEDASDGGEPKAKRLRPAAVLPV